MKNVAKTLSGIVQIVRPVLGVRFEARAVDHAVGYSLIEGVFEFTGTSLQPVDHFADVAPSHHHVAIGILGAGGNGGRG
jgi:hypothetical protein